MIHQRFNLATLSLVFLAIGCGATASLPPQDTPPNLANRLDEAVWYLDDGEGSELASPGEGVLLEDGLISPASILVTPPADNAQYVHGAFWIHVPDEPSVKFQVKVGFLAGLKAEGVFKVYLQYGADFPLLAEVAARADGTLDLVEADLSAYRGQHVMILLSTLAGDETGQPANAVWVDPKLTLL